jgi:hypothetical protein
MNIRIESPLCPAESAPFSSAKPRRLNDLVALRFSTVRRERPARCRSTPDATVVDGGARVPRKKAGLRRERAVSLAQQKTVPTIAHSAAAEIRAR